MFIRIALAAIVAVAIAGLGAVVWLVMKPTGTVDRPTVTVAAPPTTTLALLTAAHTLPVGTMLVPDDIAVRELPPALMPSGAEIDTPMARARLRGAVIQRALVPGQVITAADVVFADGHGALASLLRTGMRAVAIGVDAVSGGAGLLAPGDRVDVILTQLHADPNTAVGHKVSSELVGHDLRVIAVDQRLLQGSAAEDKDAAVPRTVTLETSSEDAQRLTVAAELGRLGLIVRPAAETSASQAPAVVLSSDPPAIVWSDDASSALGRPSVASAQSVRVSDPASEKEYPF